MMKDLCPYCYSSDVEMYSLGWISGWMICHNCGHKFKGHWENNL